VILVALALAITGVAVCRISEYRRHVSCETLGGHLHRAVIQSDVKSVRRLLAMGAPVDSAVLHGCSPLLWSTYNGPDAEVTEALLTWGADPNRRDPGMMSALAYAVCWTNVSVTRLLLRHGADPNWSNYDDLAGSTVLRLATGPIDARYEDGTGPMIEEEMPFKTHMCSRDIVLLLLDHGADPNMAAADGTTPLMSATLREWEACVILLLQHGADPNAQNVHGQTSLHYAVGRYRSTRDTATVERVARALLEAGAKPNAKDARGKKPVDYAEANGPTSTNMLILLQQYGARDDVDDLP
jgi:ankyrin repeat protein